MTELRRFSCPMTGIEFSGIVNDENGSIMIKPPFTDSPIKLKIEDGELRIPLSLYDYRPVMTVPEAAEELEISRQRIMQLIQMRRLRAFYIHHKPYVLKDEVLNYKSSRRTGRPKRK